MNRGPGKEHRVYQHFVKKLYCLYNFTIFHWSYPCLLLSVSCNGSHKQFSSIESMKCWIHATSKHTHASNNFNMIVCHDYNLMYDSQTIHITRRVDDHYRRSFTTTWRKEATRKNTARCRYNTVSFLQNPQKWHPIACPWGRGVVWLLWF